jgi:GPN-loop GTPase
MSAIGRKCSIVNLDPANEKTSYPCAIDVRKLITLDEVMDEEGLGPNGGIMYALEELEENIGWLEEGLTRLGRAFLSRNRAWSGDQG